MVKLLSRRSIVRRCFGAEHGNTHTGLAAMMIESSLLYSLVAGVGYPLLPQNLTGNNNMFSPLLAQSEVSESCSMRVHARLLISSVLTVYCFRVDHSAVRDGARLDGGDYQDSEPDAEREAKGPVDHWDWEGERGEMGQRRIWRRCGLGPRAVACAQMCLVGRSS